MKRKIKVDFNPLIDRYMYDDEYRQYRKTAVKQTKEFTDEQIDYLIDLINEGHSLYRINHKFNSRYHDQKTYYRIQKKTKELRKQIKQQHENT